jgi:segregation and condensation protein B
MNDVFIKNVVEAALLAAARPVSLAELLQLFDEQSRPAAKELRAVLEQLVADYEGRGVEIKETANGYRVQVRPERPQRYSRALLETLALIAYRQPITRAEIENVRGVAVNPNIVKTLMERGWVRVLGHREVPGHPEVLGTTREFLDYFNLKSIEDLPPLAELKAMPEFNMQLDLPVADGGEVAVVNVPLPDGTEVHVAASEPDADEPRDELNADDDGDDEELSAPGNNSAGLVAAPPSHDTD